MRSLTLTVLLVACHPASPSNGGCTTEVPYDGVDQDCDGADLGDVDGDGFAAPEANGPDCDDADPDVNPDATDTVGDGVDEDCDGIDGVDEDYDGVASTESGGSDCDDHDANAKPGAADSWYDGIDSDCLGNCDFDQDGDGVPAQSGAILEGDPCDTVDGPGVPEVGDCDDTDPLAAWDLAGTAPLQGEVVPRDEAFTATFYGDASAAVLTLADAAGHDVPGTTSIEGDLGEIAVFTPSSLLVGGAAYTFTVSSPCGEDSVDVATEVDVGAVVGDTWALALDGGDWAAPAGFGGLIAPFLDRADPILLDVLDPTAARVGSEDVDAPLTQDACAPTAEAGFDLAASPVLATTAATLSLVLDGAVLSVEEASVGGTLANGSSNLVDGELHGALDVSGLDAFFGEPACPLLSSFGIACAACPVSGDVSCVHVDVQAIPTALVAIPLVPRYQADVDADPGCP